MDRRRATITAHASGPQTLLFRVPDKPSVAIPRSSPRTPIVFHICPQTIVLVAGRPRPHALATLMTPAYSQTSVQPDRNHSKGKSMASTRSARLDNITDEVAQLHPLLLQLLPKLPSVTEVEYTHGPSEMGADFVFARLDDALNTTRYVAVIAKTGRIRQDHSEIDRQITECAIPRLFQGGTRKVRIDEIWIIVTGTVTRNAQEKIHATYRVQNIQFIDGPRLEALIDKHLPFFWTHIPVEIGSYLNTLRLEVEDWERALSFIPSTDTPSYVEPDIEKTEFLPYELKYRRPKPPTKINIHDEIDHNPVLIIEASLGLGKSALFAANRSPLHQARRI